MKITATTGTTKGSSVMNRISILVAILAIVSFGPVQAEDIAQSADKAVVCGGKVFELVKANVDSAKERIEVGGTFAGVFDNDWRFKTGPAFSVLGVLTTKQVFNGYVFWGQRYDGNMKFGLSYSYMTEQAKNLAGVGASFTVFRIAPVIEGVRDSVPVASAATPRLEVLKAFASLNVDCDRPFDDPRPAFCVGIAVPFGGK